MQPAPAERTGQRPRFPALDPEPPPRRWRRAWVPIVAGAVVAAGYFGYAALRPGGHAETAARVRGLPITGLVLAETSSGVLSLTDMHTGRSMLLKKLGQFPDNPPPSVSPDGKYFVSPAMGTLLSLADPARPTPVPNSLTFPSSTNLTLPSPFSDHNASLLIQAYTFFYQTDTAHYSVQSVATGRTSSLGVGDNAAGDPRAPGAFVTYAIPTRLTPPHGVQPDVRLELRDVGAKPLVLATAAAIDHVLGIKPRDGVRLVPFPNPQGSMVAVTVAQIAGNGVGGVVVYSRSGKLLGFQAVGPGGGGGLAWSRSGTMLAYVGQGAGGAELTQWEIGGQSTTIEMPVPLKQVAECLWSPDDLSVLCAGGPGGPWYPMLAGLTYLSPGHGLPLAWYGGRLAG